MPVLLGFAGLWSVFEWIRYQFFCGFPFSLVGFSLSCHSYSIQFASLFGVLGLSFWTILTNLLALRFFYKTSSLSYLLQWGIISLIPYFFGFVSFEWNDKVRSYNEEESYVLLVQTGLLPSQKYRVWGKESEYIHPIKQWRSILEEIALHKKDKVDLILLPEAAVPLGFDRAVYEISFMQEELVRAFGEEVIEYFPITQGSRAISNSYIAQTIANFFDAQLLVGLDRETGLANYNSIISFERGKTPEIYDKRILLPLAEYVPFSWMRQYSQSYGVNDFFSPGVEAKVLGRNKAFASVCYEELFPELMRAAKRMGAKMIINSTNDGWFPKSKLSEQHFSQGILRAVENGIPLIQCSATGATAIVDAMGQVIEKLPHPYIGSIYTKVLFKQHFTLFSYIGHAPILWMSCFLVFGLRKAFFKSKIPIISYA
jgi:apolipoprotein N-acyltransferase